MNNQPPHHFLYMANCMDVPWTRARKPCPWATLPRLHLLCERQFCDKVAPVCSPLSKAALSYNSTAGGCDKPYKYFRPIKPRTVIASPSDKVYFSRPTLPAEKWKQRGRRVF